MNDAELAARARQLADKATEHAGEYSGVIGTVKGFILTHFGPNGLIAACVILTVVVVLIAAKAAKLTLSAVKYLVVPALVLAFLGTFVLPYSFVVLLPITATLCSLGLLFRG